MSTLTATQLPTLEQSRAYCHALTRREAKNFYYGLKLLPEPKRSAMYALYAYMRLVDDIADELDGRDLAQRIADLDEFRQHTHAVLKGETASPNEQPLWPAFHELVSTYKIPATLFDAMIDGQRQDLTPPEIVTFQQLHDYCYRVASVVGLASIYVWGFTGGEATEALAVDRGIAFQLTNILRDIKEDAGLGRVYLPTEDLQRFGVTLEQIREGRSSAGFLEMMQFQVQRTQEYYDRSAPLAERITPESRPTLNAMTAIYHGLLRKVKRNPEEVLHRRIRLGLAAKVMIAWRAMRER